MINFIDKKRSKELNRKYIYMILIVFTLVVISSGVHCYKLKTSKELINLEKENIEDEITFQIFNPKKETFKEIETQIFEYKQKNDFLTISVQGRNLEDINNFNKNYFKELKITKVEKKKDNNYSALAEGKVFSEVSGKDRVVLRRSFEKDLFLENDFILKGIDLLKYDNKEDRTEFSLQGEIENLLMYFEEYSREKRYENLEYIIKRADKDLYILTFKGSL